MSTYRTIYTDVEGNVFVGDYWNTQSLEDYHTACELEQKVFEEIPVIEKIEIALVTDTFKREE